MSVEHDNLVSYYQTQHTVSSESTVVAPRGCPRRHTQHLVDVPTGLLVTAGCYSQRCPVCLRTIALRQARAIALARPTHHVLLTQTGEDWPEVRRRIASWRRSIKRVHSDFQDAFHVEPNPRGSGTHVHMWSWGGEIDSILAADAAARAGMGREADVTPRRAPDGAPLVYGLKMVLAPPIHGASPESATRYQLVNGGRLTHASRGFWRDADDTPLAGIRAAMTAASRTTSADWALTTIAGP